MARSLRRKQDELRGGQRYSGRTGLAPERPNIILPAIHAGHGLWQACGNQDPKIFLGRPAPPRPWAVRHPKFASMYVQFRLYVCGKSKVLIEQRQQRADGNLRMTSSQAPIILLNRVAHGITDNDA